MRPEHLVIRLEQELEDASWIVLDENGYRLKFVRGPLEQATTETKNRSVTVLIPGLDVITTQAKLPAKRISKIRQILPFSLEETRWSFGKHLPFKNNDKTSKHLFGNQCSNPIHESRY